MQNNSINNIFWPNEYTILELNSKKKKIILSNKNNLNSKNNELIEINKKIKSIKKKLNLPDNWSWSTKLKIPPLLAEFIKVPFNSELNRYTITALIDEELEKQNLLYNGNKYVYRTNNQINKIFGLTNDVNKSIDQNDPNGFNVNTLSKYITFALENY
jgi:hypothetical protein